MTEAPADAPTAMGRREQKKQDTRRALKDAALSLAHANGVDHVTVEDITDAVGVSPRTFFNYFECKEDALIGQTTGVSEEVHAAILNRPAGEPVLQTLRYAVGESHLLREAHSHRENMLARQRLVHDNPALMARQLAQAVALERAIHTALAARMGLDPQQDLRPQLLASVAVGVLRVALRRWAREGARLDELIDESFATLTAELSAPAS